LYFRVIPIRKEEERQVATERTRTAPEVIEVADGRTVEVQGTPMTIETNLSSLNVEVTFPIDPAIIPAASAARAEFLNSLAVYIDHSDGEKVLQTGELAYNESGEPIGITIAINKFSTFTIVSMKDETERHITYMVGYPDGTFQPDKPVTRAEMATILSRLLSDSQSRNGEAFPDVGATHWAAQAIGSARASGMMEGDATGAFRPDDTITRAEMAAITARWLKLAATDGSTKFTDTAGHWADSAIGASEAAGILKGYEDSRFKPDANLTRAEAVTAINRMLNREPLTSGTGQTWSDVPAVHWAFGDIEEASKEHTSASH